MDSNNSQPARLENIRAARDRLRGVAIETPLVPLDIPGVSATLFLKLENLQRGGSFKVRPAGNRILNLSDQERRRGVFTASSGNFGIAVALLAAEAGIPAAVVAPDDAPPAKLATIRELGAKIHLVSFNAWWDVILTHRYAGTDGVFVSADSLASMEGNGTIGLEIFEQLPDVDTIMMSYGSGGLSCGIAAAIKAVKPDTRIIACESEAATPFAAARRNAVPTDVTYTSSFISGMGSTRVLDSIWPLTQSLLDGSAVVSLDQAAGAVKLLLEYGHIVAEGAGAVPVAAALAGGARGKTVCVVSGGNISVEALAQIADGEVPAA